MSTSNSIAACANPACAKAVSDVNIKERPILFSAPMVRALLDGSKTQTRRIIKPAPQMVTDHSIAMWAGEPAVLLQLLARSGKCCPYGQPGDRLWVRETWQGPLLSEGDEFEAYRESPDDFKKPAYCEYAADGGPKPEFMTDDDELVCRWRPSIFMPRWASRITLEIVSVRVERLQAISEADARAEGTSGGHGSIRGYGYSATPLEHYRDIWQQINGPSSWDANPWVWAIEFRKLP